MNKDILRRTIATFFSFSSALLLMLGLAAFIAWGVCSPAYAKAVLTRTDYPQQARAEIAEELSYYTTPSGLPEDFFADYPEEQQLLADIVTAADCAFSGEPFTPTAFSESLHSRLSAYAQNQIHATQESSADSIQMLVTYCTTAYCTYTASAPLRLLGQMGGYLQPAAPLGGGFCLVLGLVLLLLLTRLGKEHARFYIACALGGGGLLLAVFPGIVLLSGGVSRLVVSSPALFTLLSVMLYSLLGLLVAAGVVLIFLAILVRLPALRRTPAHEQPT